jgi:carboxylesterase
MPGKDWLNWLGKRWPGMLILLILIVVVAMILLPPWNIDGLTSHPNPARSYEEAVQRVAAYQAAEPDNINPMCRSDLMTQGKKVDRVIILVHGFTNCSYQFHALGKRFYDLGYNVLLLTMPHHGLADKMTTDLSNLTAGELVAYTDTAMDIAQGLGDHVTMAGLSGGGVTTAWAAQNRSDLDQAVMIAPSFGFRVIPTPLTAAVGNLYATLPEAYDWWNPLLLENNPPPQGYPRYSRHALAQIIRLGQAVLRDAAQAAPAKANILMITNASDMAVNNDLADRIAGDWQKHGAQVTAYEFPLDLHLGHDLIDPGEPDQKVDIVYAKLIELINQ